MGGASYQYDGEGRHVQQTVSSIVTKYLLDTQPGLAVVLSQDVGGDVTRFVHAPRGIHARQDATNDWHWTVQDGLGTVRLETDNSAGVEGAQNLDPFGNLIDLNGTIGTPYGFTGELVDGSGLLDLRTRRYNAGLGTFASLDPFEGMRDRAMSLNGYSWVEGNVPNASDPTGKEVSIDKIRNSETFYSCRCGWIDLEHANPIHALNLIRTIKNALNPQIYATASNCTGVVFQTRLGTWTGYQMAVGSGLVGGNLPWYLIPRNIGNLDWYTVSAQVYSDLVQEFERQEVSSWFPAARTSGQSVEDLPSYAIAFGIAYRLEGSGLSDPFYQSPDQIAYLRETIFNMDFMKECEPILDAQLNEKIFNEIEPASARNFKNDTFIPANRAPELDSICTGTPRDSSRIPLWLGLTALNMHLTYNYRKTDGRQGCDNQAIKLPYPNDPDNPADRDLPESLLLYKCGGC